MANGASFCHVIKRKQFNHDNPSITEGNHIWKGAAPIFSNKVREIIEFMIVSSDVGIIIFKIIRVNSMDDAKAWMIKYFMAASVDIMFSLEDMRGMNDIRLISRPIHVAGHELDLIEIKVPRINMSKNKSFEELKIEIKKKRINTFISGVWTH